MTVTTVAAMLSAFSAVLAAEEALPHAASIGPADEVRVAIEAVRRAARTAIEAAVAAPVGARDCLALLGNAVDLEGVESPLVARVARALADAIEVAAPNAA